MTERVERMLSQAPEYYETSAVYAEIQAAQGNEYDTEDNKNADLKAQLRIKTATWGLKYYEDQLHIPTITTDSYETRRGRVLSRWRSPGNFSASLVKTVCESFVNGQVDVTFDMAKSEVIIKFNGPFGVPEKIVDVVEAVENVIHAHLGKSFSYRYLKINELNALKIKTLNETKLNNFASLN
ncbi:putative phage tail protein [Paenibacillus sinopodophylli]|uniref:putative phage tail protein n=1 Tax=Paenibacillus sinopodophylli TaxID=1837342 RepID=UPI00110D1919|nr:putative phage tail protein [Paenibacillus sinopodophylli]